jgi:nitrite reductase/ring-hydroxylating ferredoxin subunit
MAAMMSLHGLLDALYAPDHLSFASIADAVRAGHSLRRISKKRLMENSFHRAARAEDLTEGKALGTIVNGWPVLLAMSEGKLHATIDRCTHAASELSTGRIRRGAVMCPLHGARFELASGRCVGGAYKALMVFETRSDGDWIEVAVPDAQPGFEHMPVRAKT